MGLSSLLGGIFSLFNLCLLLFYDVRLALVAAVLVLAAVTVTVALSLGQLRYQKELAEIQGKISSLVMQVLGGIAKFRVAGAENRAFYLWAGRLSTIINADRIYVLDQGRVVQSGNYEQLMREEGLFAAMARRQLA